MVECMVKLVEPVVDNSCWMTGVEALENEPKGVIKKVKKIVLLNSPLAFPGYIVYADRISPECAKEVVKEAVKAGKKIESYIGHPVTAKVASQILGISVPVNREMYMPKQGDLAIVFRLKKRLPRPSDIENIKPEDIEILTVHYA